MFESLLASLLMDSSPDLLDARREDGMEGGVDTVILDSLDYPSFRFQQEWTLLITPIEDLLKWTDSSLSPVCKQRELFNLLHIVFHPWLLTSQHQQYVRSFEEEERIMSLCNWSRVATENTQSSMSFESWQWTSTSTRTMNPLRFTLDSTLADAWISKWIKRCYNPMITVLNQLMMIPDHIVWTVA